MSEKITSSVGVNKNPNDIWRGVILMVTHAIAMSILYIVGKTLTTMFAPEQIAFLYKFSVLAVVFPYSFKGGLVKNLKTSKIKLHMARGAFSLIGSICFYHGLASIQTIDAAAITYLEHIIVLVIGILYFKEKITLAKLVLVILGFSGALLVTKPGFDNFNSSYLYIFAALTFWAFNNWTIKILGRTERTQTQLFYTALFGTIYSAPFAFYKDWSGFQLVHLKYISVMSTLYLIHIIAFFRAFKYADISAVMPFDYTRIMFTGILGYLVLGEVPKESSILGYALIACGGLYFIFDEAHRRAKARDLKEKVKNLETELVDN